MGCDAPKFILRGVKMRRIKRSERAKTKTCPHCRKLIGDEKFASNMAETEFAHRECHLKFCEKQRERELKA
jgi:hypothetical protein